jgi:hypothetical protein
MTVAPHASTVSLDRAAIRDDTETSRRRIGWTGLVAAFAPLEEFPPLIRALVRE